MGSKEIMKLQGEVMVEKNLQNERIDEMKKMLEREFLEEHISFHEHDRKIKKLEKQHAQTISEIKAECSRILEQYQKDWEKEMEKLLTDAMESTDDEFDAE